MAVAGGEQVGGPVSARRRSGVALPAKGPQPGVARRLIQPLAFLGEGPALAATGAVLIITALHYGTTTQAPTALPYHDLYRQLYVVPILLMAVRYGLRGGAIFSVATMLLYLPHLIALCVAYPGHRLDTVSDQVVQLVGGVLTGALVDARRRRERLAAIGDRASRLVHDVRGPLSVIGQAVDHMAEPDVSDEERRHVADMARSQVRWLEDLSGGVLDYARGGAALNLTECGLVELLDRVMSLHQDVLARGGIELAAHAPTDATLRADVSRLHCALANLLQNAREAMPEGGRVTVSASVQGDRALIQVSDSGPGIPQEVTRTLFDPFVTVGKPGGTGLGLAIARDAIAAHGGQIAVESAPGQGTTFTVSLPLG